MSYDLIEKMARAMAKRNYPGASERDIDEMWDGWTEEAAVALSVALDAIGEECAEVASDAWWSHKTEEAPALIRARIAEMKRDLPTTE